jgi:ATP-dependent RNA helicase SUPV3L1/SUV3
VAPEVARRLGRIAAEPDDAFALTPDGTILWRGQAAAALAGDRPFAPRVRLFGELGAAPARERAARRIEAFLAAEAGRRLPSLRRLEEAVTSGALKGLPRGLAYRLIEAGGVLARSGLETELKSLSQAERRALRSLGVALGAFALFLPELAGPARGFARAFALAAMPDWAPAEGQLVALPSPRPNDRALSLRGLAAVGRLAAPVEQLQRLDELLRSAAKQGEGILFSDQAREELGWSDADARGVLRALGYSQVGRPPSQVWKKRAESRSERAPRVAPGSSPFAALAALTPPARRRRRRAPRRAHG